MFQDLIDFIEKSSVEEVRQMLKENDVKFKSDMSKKYDNMTKSINENLNSYNIMDTNVTFKLKKKSQINWKNINNQFQIYEEEVMFSKVKIVEGYNQGNIVDMNERRDIAS